MDASPASGVGKARDLRRSYKKPPCEQERAALGLAVCGLDQKARDLRRSYKMPPCERERAALGLAVCWLNRKVRCASQAVQA